MANDLRNTMQQHASVFRTQALMSEGVGKVMAIAERVKRIGLKDKSKVFNTARIEALEVENLIEAAKATIVSAAAYSEGNRLDYKPVQLKPLTVESVPPKVRTF